MEWVREWIMKIAGITALGAVCDMIMTDGHMKKYVRMIVGLVLIFAIISPITEITPDIPEITLPHETQKKAVQLKTSITEKEHRQIVALYSEKLEKSMENKIYSDYGFEALAEVEVEENAEESFGNITFVLIKIPPESKERIEDIKMTVSKDFGVDTRNISVEVKN